MNKTIITIETIIPTVAKVLLKPAALDFEWPINPQIIPARDVIGTIK